jgi:DNA-binding MarR family transcriptional regulator
MKKIKAKIQQESSVTNERKSELLSLLSVLESEITRLSKSDSEHAESIAGFIERSTHEATRRKKHPDLLTISLAGLTASVKGFEASHPVLVADINNICTVLANMGI